MAKKLTQTIVNKAKPGDKPIVLFDSDVRGFCLRIQPSGKKVFYVKIKSGGKWTFLKVGGADKFTPESARDEAKKKLARAELGEDVAEERRTKPVSTLKEYLETVYEPFAKDRYRSGAHIVKRIKSSFEWLLSTRVTDIKLSRVEAWAGGRIKGKDAVSGVTVNKDIMALRAALERGVELGYFPSNPLDGVHKVKENPKVITRYLTPDEEAALMTALDEREKEIRDKRKSHNKWLAIRKLPLKPDLSKAPFADYLKVAVIVALHTGLRRNELLSLTWADVSFEENTVHVRGHAAKSGKPRAIPMSATCRETLKGWKEMNEGETLVFPGPGDSVMHDMRTSFERVIAAAEITGFRYHDLRHSFASRLVQSGVDLNTVRELMGHADLKMVLRYAHLDDERKQRAVEVLDKPRGNIVPFRGQKRARR